MISRACEDVHTFQPYLLGLSEGALLACISRHEFDEVHLCLYSEFCLPSISLELHGYYHDSGGVLRFGTMCLYHEDIFCPSLGHHPFPFISPSFQVRLVLVLLLLVRLWQFCTSRNSRKAC